MPKGRQPIVQPAIEKVYGSDWKDSFVKDYSNLSADQAAEKLSNACGIIINAGALYGFVKREIENFSFVTTGRKGKPSILQPVLDKAYSSNWLIEFQKLIEGMNLEQATESLNKEFDLNLSTSYVYGFCKKNDIEFEKTGEAPKQRGKQSTTIPLLLKHFKTEDNLKDALNKLNGCKIVDLAASINKEAKTSISVGNFYSIVKKYGIDLTYTRSHKSREENEPGETSKDVVKPEIIAIQHGIPVKFTCQTKNCEGSVAQLVEVKYGFALRARRCSCCGKFGTYKAQYKENGEIVSVVLSEIDGILSEVIESPELVGV